jgi:tRNA-2-methylthio-N6-dimethylallyladenosine synthase
MTLSTDIIVGFPGETQDDFQATFEFFEEISFDMAFIFRYSPRDGTPAASYPEQIPENIKVERQQKLLQLLGQHSRLHNQKLIGTTQSILVEGKARYGDGQLWGRNPGFRKVIFEGKEALIGQFASVKIETTSTTALSGKIVSQRPESIELRA